MSERCEKMFPHLSSMVDGEVDDEIRASVGVHLSECNICTDRLETLQSLRGALQDLVDDEPPAGFVEETEAWVRAQPRASSVSPGLIALAIVIALLAGALGWVSGGVPGAVIGVVIVCVAAFAELFRRGARTRP